MSEGCGWNCLGIHPRPDAIEHQAGNGTCLYFNLAQLAEQLKCNSRKDALRQTRSRVLKIGSSMLREATAADRRALQELKKARAS